MGCGLIRGGGGATVQQTCSFAGGDIPIFFKNDKNISSSIAVSFSSVKGTIGTDTWEPVKE